MSIKKRLTSSSFPHTQAASSGAPGIFGNSLREGNTVESGFQGSWLGSCTEIDKDGDRKVDRRWKPTWRTLSAILESV